MVDSSPARRYQVARVRVRRGFGFEASRGWVANVRTLPLSRIGCAASPTTVRPTPPGGDTPARSLSNCPISKKLELVWIVSLVISGELDCAREPYLWFYVCRQAPVCALKKNGELGSW